MPSPPIQLFLTTIASAPVLRQKQEYLLRVLQVKKIPFVSYDLASDENAKRLWRRRAPKAHQTLPGMLIGGVWRGTFEEFEAAVECQELETFLRLNEEYDPDIDGKTLAAQPIGVPGAAMPLQMQGHKASFAPTGPTPMKKSGEVGTGEELVDAGDVLPGYGFQGLKVTINELTDLAKELGLNDKDTIALRKKAGSSKAGSSQPQDVELPPTVTLEKAEDKALESSTGDKATVAPEPKSSVKAGEADDKPATETQDDQPTVEQSTVAPLKFTKTAPTVPTEEKGKEDASPLGQVKSEAQQAEP